MPVKPTAPDYTATSTWVQRAHIRRLCAAAQSEAVDAALSLFYSAAAGGVGSGSTGQTFSRSPERKTLMMHYALALALHAESFAMAPEQVRTLKGPRRRL